MCSVCGTFTQRRERKTIYTYIMADVELSFHSDAFACRAFAFFFIIKHHGARTDTRTTNVNTKTVPRLRLAGGVSPSVVRRGDGSRITCDPSFGVRNVCEKIAVRNRKRAVG